MKIETVKVSRRFYLDDGTEETIELTANPVIGANIDKMAVELRAEILKCGTADNMQTLQDICGQIEIARLQLEQLHKQLNEANDRITIAREFLLRHGLSSSQVYDLLAIVNLNNESN